MDPKIINDVFSYVTHKCCMCECADGNHLIFWKCPIFYNEFICSECCSIEFLKDGIDKKVSVKLGKPITTAEINSSCLNCGMNNACQNQDLANKIELGMQGENNGPEQDGPKKTR